MYQEVVHNLPIASTHKTPTHHCITPFLIRLSQVIIFLPIHCPHKNETLQGALILHMVSQEKDRENEPQKVSKKKISQWNPHYSLVSISSDLPPSKSEYKIPANGGKKQPHRSTRHYNFSWNPQSNSSSPPSHNTLSLSRSLSFSSWWKAQFVTRKEFLLANIKNKQTKQDAFFLHHLIQLFLV